MSVFWRFMLMGLGDPVPAFWAETGRAHATPRASAAIAPNTCLFMSDPFLLRRAGLTSPRGSRTPPDEGAGELKEAGKHQGERMWSAIHRPNAVSFIIAGINAGSQIFLLRCGITRLAPPVLRVCLP